MRKLVLISSLMLCLPVGSALARVDAGDVATSAGVSASLYSTFKDDKMVIPARDDVSAFVASGGRSEERRVGKECQRMCRSRWSPYH